MPAFPLSPEHDCRFLLAARCHPEKTTGDAGGPFQCSRRRVAERLREVELQITERAARQKALEHAMPADPKQIRAALTAAIRDWRAMLRSEPSAGRRVLQTLIDGRLTFTPMADEEGEFYEVRGLDALPEIIGGKTPVNLASPGIPTWNQIHAFLQEMRRLREMGISAA